MTPIFNPWASAAMATLAVTGMTQRALAAPIALSRMLHAFMGVSTAWNERHFAPALHGLRSGPMQAGGDGQEGLESAPCRRPISARRNTRLNRSWQDADTCSSSVELTLSTVTAPAARMVALRLAPGT